MPNLWMKPLSLNSVKIVAYLSNTVWNILSLYLQIAHSVIFMHIKLSRSIKRLPNRFLVAAFSPLKSKQFSRHFNK